MRRLCMGVVAGTVLASFAAPALAVHQVGYFAAPQWGAGLGTEIKGSYGQDSVVSPTAVAPGSTTTSQSIEGAYALARTLTTPSPDLSADASASLSGTSEVSAHGGAAATLSYSFEVVGPNGNVPTIISATGSTSVVADGSADGSGIAILEIYSGSTVLVDDTTCAGNGIYACPNGEVSTLTMDQRFSLVANQYYTVYMSIAADADATYAYTTFSGQVWAAASLDPYIMIDPQFADAGEYSLYVTPGLGNAAPEPAAWTMVLLGFGGVGARLRTGRTCVAGG